MVVQAESFKQNSKNKNVEDVLDTIALETGVRDVEDNLIAAQTKGKKASTTQTKKGKAKTKAKTSAKGVKEATEATLDTKKKEGVQNVTESPEAVSDTESVTEQAEEDGQKPATSTPAKKRTKSTVSKKKTTEDATPKPKRRRGRPRKNPEA